eukprot:2143503-Prymnesium_polylepis.1
MTTVYESFPTLSCSYKLSRDAAIARQLVFELAGSASELASVESAAEASTQTITCGIIGCTQQFPADESRQHA